MLIVSIPKSGSTALMETLGRVHKVDYKQMSFEELELEGKKCAEEVKPLWLFHGDLSDVSEDILEKMSTDRCAMFKQHITPSAANLHALADHKIVVLHRDPNQIVESYYRGFSKNIHVRPYDFPREGNLLEWKLYAQKSGLSSSLEWWERSWNQHKNPNWLHISFTELTKNTADVIAAIEKHLGLEISSTQKLVKARYSRSFFTPYRYNRRWRNRIAKVKSVLSQDQPIHIKFGILVKKILAKAHRKNDQHRE